MEQKLAGLGLGFGKKFGQAQIYPLSHIDVPCYTIDSSQISEEIKRFQSAVQKAQAQLLKQREKINAIYGPTPAEVFNVQLALLMDAHLHNQVEQQIKHTLKNVEFCLQLTEQQCTDELPEEQFSDLHEIIARVLKHLLSPLEAETSLAQKIIVAKSLLLSDVLFFENHAVGGIVLEEDCPTSHVTILLKHLNIPIVIGVPQACEKIHSGDDVLIDGNLGEVCIHPEHPEIIESTTVKSPHHALTQEGVVIHFEAVYAPSLSKDSLQNLGVEGIGLVRTEALFLNPEDVPTEEAQFQLYRSLLQQNEPYPVVFRTWDVGGDKKESMHFHFEPENNPFLGQRGMRFCLKHPEVFKPQLRAILRASAYGQIKLLYPVITDAMEVMQANALLKECQLELKKKGIPFKENLEVGLMLEVPSVAFILDQLSENVSFFSIGTNDWIQYLLARDRTNAQVSSLKNMTHPAVLRSLKKLVGHAEQLLIPVYLCGEMANTFIPFLMCLGLGIRSFICHGPQIPKLKALVQSVSLQDLKSLAEDAYFMTTQTEIWTLFEDYFKKILNKIKKSGSK